jgi:thymidylate synthase (FAD)
VARQIVRHRTANWNEMSARYSEVPEEYYLPDEKRMNPQGGTSIQSSAEYQIVEKPLEIRYGMDVILQDAFSTYNSLIDRGLARELARSVTPVGAYTQWYWKIDLRNLLHFIHLRADKHAQWEVRQYANALAEIVKVWVPTVWDAFEDYVVNAVTLSGPEVAEMRQAIQFIILAGDRSGLDKLALPTTMSKGERKEYVKKLNKILPMACDLWYHTNCEESKKVDK